MYNFRTDLASERREIYQKTNDVKGEIDGITSEVEDITDKIKVEKVKIINENGEVLLQKRAAEKKRNPNMWSKTGGHVISGEEPIEALKREVYEELGIKIHENDIILVGIHKSNDGKNRYFGYNFIVKTNYSIKEMKLQKEEVSDVKFISIEELLNIKKNNDINYTFNKWNDKDFYEEIETIKRYIVFKE